MTKPANATAGATTTTHDLVGLETDSLLAFLAALGLMRSLETSRPGWRARLSWVGPPWVARLHLDEPASQDDVAAAAAEGITAITEHYVFDRPNVSFTREEFRDQARTRRSEDVPAALMAALAAEHPLKVDGRLQAAPLVMMFGQGHQNFLERLTAIPRGELPHRLKKLKRKPDHASLSKITEALFAPWTRADDADAFRWDPTEDQRYALRFGDPSTAGAASTVIGANRLAAVGFLSYPCLPGTRLTVPGTRRGGRGGVTFTWPLWRMPLSRHGIDRLVSHPDVLAGDLATLRPLGVVEIMRARRISNGKLISVARAMPASASAS
jgi:hypothetical protein